MPAKVYCLASAKGGSGKTVLCASFAAFLADLGKKVLVVDTDEATSGLSLLYLNAIDSARKEAAGKGTASPRGVFDGGTNSIDRSWHTIRLSNGVTLLPATFGFSPSEASANDRREALESMIGWAREAFDFVFLDAQAGVDDVARVAMSREISDEVILVSEYDPLSAAGIERLKAILRDELTFDRTWIQLNKLLPDFAQSFSEFLQVTKYLTPIPWNADVVRAYTRRRLPVDLEFGNSFTLAIMQSLKGLLGDNAAAEIEQWAEKRASSIRQPLEQQYRDAEKELQGLLIQEGRLSRAALLRKWAMMSLGIVPGFGALVAMIATDFFGFIATSDAGWPAMTAALSAFGAVVLAMSGWLLLRTSALRSPGVEGARLKRQLEVVEDRLKKLEVLRSASLETLIEAGQE